MARTVKIAQTTDLPAGRGMTVDVEGRSIALFNVDGQFCATSGHCTHAEALLAEGELAGPIVTCPLHGAEFNVVTGEALTPPAFEDVQIYAVRVEGEDVLLELED